ncbi:hypothetical protein GDO81_002245 [Engystomops pustulosus]|uniref:Uncharacterized protein n=1 Tax=Engystomops pustulosus TaxID=76066 RepID=A0AAV7DII1_ENGPU|nr:hypothetical protein GDO81_002245 [Engystomops pustulosus]
MMSRCNLQKHGGALLCTNHYTQDGNVQPSYCSRRRRILRPRDKRAFVRKMAFRVVAAYQTCRMSLYPICKFHLL